MTKKKSKRRPSLSLRTRRRSKRVKAVPKRTRRTLLQREREEREEREETARKVKARVMAKATVRVEEEMEEDKENLEEDSKKEKESLFQILNGTPKSQSFLPSPRDLRDPSKKICTLLLRRSRKKSM